MRRATRLGQVHRVVRSLRVLLAAGRAATVLVLLLGGALFGLGRAAEASVGEALRGFGAELVRWPELRAHSGPRRLVVNGLEIQLLSATVDDDVAGALERLHGHCRRRGGLDVPKVLRERLPNGLDGTFRQESEREGVLACLDMGRPLRAGEALEALERFVESGDLSELGGLRYMLARRNGAKTTVLSIWTEGRAPILDLFPRDGDAPGVDPRGVPRPAGSRRLLSAAEQGAPYSVTAYVVDGGSAASLLGWYTQSLEALGWAVNPDEARGALMARRGERCLVVRAGVAKKSGALVVSVVELS